MTVQRRTVRRDSWDNRPSRPPRSITFSDEPEGRDAERRRNDRRMASREDGDLNLLLLPQLVLVSSRFGTAAARGADD